MSCENLVCGACAGVVVEGRCTACRATRAHVHETAGFPASAVLWAALVVALLLLVALQLG